MTNLYSPTRRKYRVAPRKVHNGLGLVAPVALAVAAMIGGAAYLDNATQPPASWALVVAHGNDTDIADHGLTYGDCMFEAGRATAAYQTVFCEVER